MIATIFTLSFALLLLLQIGAADAIQFLLRTIQDVDAEVGHDTKIYPDYQTP